MLVSGVQQSESVTLTLTPSLEVSVTHFFSFFCLHSVLWQWFPHSIFQLTYLFFCLLFYWFFLVYFLSYYVVHLCLFFKSSLFKTFLVSSWSMPPFFFWDFESSLPLLLWIIFQVDCLSSSLPLVVTLGFNFVASSAHISLVFSFCLSVFVVSFPQTAGSQFLLLLYLAPGGWGAGPGVR